MNPRRDHLLGWPPAMVEMLIAEPRPSNRTPRRPTVSAAEERYSFRQDIHETNRLSYHLQEKKLQAALAKIEALQTIYIAPTLSELGKLAVDVACRRFADVSLANLSKDRLGSLGLAGWRAQLMYVKGE